MNAPATSQIHIIPGTTAPPVCAVCRCETDSAWLDEHIGGRLCPECLVPALRAEGACFDYFQTTP